VQRAQRGIIYIDEIDKIARKTTTPRSPRDVSARASSRRSSRSWRGPSPTCPPQGGRKHPHQDFIQIDTTNILFICGGAFEGLEKIVEERSGSAASASARRRSARRRSDAG
jgi:ATP-dependent Clp protease ATP-binding subunit ClpX